MNAVCADLPFTSLTRKKREVYAVDWENEQSRSPSPTLTILLSRFASSEETSCPISLESNISGAMIEYHDFIFHLSTTFVFFSAMASLHEQRSLLRVVLPVSRKLPVFGVVFHEPADFRLDVDELGAVVLVRAVGAKVDAHVHRALYQAYQVFRVFEPYPSLQEYLAYRLAAEVLHGRDSVVVAQHHADCRGP